MEECEQAGLMPAPFGIYRFFRLTFNIPPGVSWLKDSQQVRSENRLGNACD